MIEIILISIITALVCNGLKIATDNDKMILYPFRKWADKVFIEMIEVGKGTKKHMDIKVSKLYYPILYCIKCMPSFYGTILCLYFFPFDYELPNKILITILCASPIATILNKLIIND